MKNRTLSLVIVGHIDHGKSTLIGRLLFDTDSVPDDLVAEVRAISEELGKEMEFAYFLDALEEEREQNITIDTTQTFFSTPEREYIIIDAPGHREFLKNMITGASQAEAAVLMVDAEQGMEEQTSRHAYILSMLGVKQVLVAVNKMDAVEFGQEVYEKVKASTEEFLDKLGVQALHLIPLSARTGANVVVRSKEMPWYSGPTLLDALATFETPKVLLDRPLRFPVQDVYEVEGRKVVVGRVESGRMKSGDPICVLPAGSEDSIKSIEVWKGVRSEAGAGESIGLTFAGGLELERGDVICTPGGEAPTPVKEVSATVFWLSPEGYSVGDTVTLQCATQSVDCQISSIPSRIDSSTLEVISEDGERLEEAEAAKVVLATSAPVVVEDFLEIEELGRFVLVRDDRIIAGGIVHVP